MQFSLNWLQKFFNTPLNSKQLADKLTEAGLEVDAVIPVKASFDKVIAAKVLKTEPHPDADRLCVATVFDGKEELQVVCGASNCRAGLVTALAPVGTTLWDSTGKKHTIKKGKLRGVESFGMLMSLEELGLVEKSEGIVELGEDCAIGQELAPLFTDECLEISYTPNLGHAMSHLGLAREIACHFDLKYALPDAPALKKESKQTADLFKVHVETPKLCRRYGCCYIRNVKIGPSPLWLKLKLKSCGIRSINNVVDATNWALQELGQPMHAFDADKLSGNQMQVAPVKEATPFETLDYQTRKLPENTLVIMDAQKPVAIAGVMGGAYSQVTENTTHVLLESAVFAPKAVRRTCRSLGLYTDGSKRFERGTDPELVLKSLERAAALIQEIAGGEVYEPYVIEFTKEKKKQITCRTARVNQLLGTHLDSMMIGKLLEKLEFKIEAQNQEALEIIVPSYRNDIQIEEDLIEEVARAYGFENLTHSENKSAITSLSDTPVYQMEQKLHALLVSQGLQEVISCDLISPEMEQMQSKAVQPLKVLNCMSQEQSVLRSSLLANHLSIVKHNQDRQNANLQIYEIGKVYHRKGECYEEEEKLALTLVGRENPYHYSASENPLDFFHLKGKIENVLEAIHVKNFHFEKSAESYLHPGVQASLFFGETLVGHLGELHPKVLREMGIKQTAFFAQLRLPGLLPSFFEPLKIQEISPFPSSERDWTFTSLEDLEIGHLLKMIGGLSSRLLKDVFLLDLYRSEKIGIDKKNVTLRFVYRNDKKTISFEAVEIEHARVISEVQEKMKQLIIQQS